MGVLDQIVHTLLYGQMELAAIAARISAVGADGVDLAIEKDGVNKPERLLKMPIRRILADNGLKVSACTPFYVCEGMDICHTDEKLRSETIEFSKRSIDVVAHAGCDRMLIVPGTVSVNHRYHISREEDWKRGVEALHLLGEYAAGRGVMLMIEPINRYRAALVHTIDEALRMIRDIGLGNIFIVADTFHMQMEEIEGVPVALRKAAYYLQCLHIGDNTRRAPGYGVMDWKTIVAALYDIGYDGPLSLETLYTGFDPDRVCRDPGYMNDMEEQLRFGISFLRETMNAAIRARETGSG